MSSTRKSQDTSTPGANKKPINGFDGNKKRFHSDHHHMKKRPTAKPFQRKNDIFITNKSNFKVQVKQCEEILNAGVDDVYLHCVGNAITRGINLALTLIRESNSGLGYEANTSTIEMIDDFHPLRDDDDFTIQQRLNSCLHIRVYRHAAAVTSSQEATN